MKLTSQTPYRPPRCRALAGHDCEDIDLLAVHADAAAIGHQYVTVVEAYLCLAPMNGRRGAISPRVGARILNSPSSRIRSLAIC